MPTPLVFVSDALYIKQLEGVGTLSSQHPISLSSVPIWQPPTFGRSSPHTYMAETGQNWSLPPSSFLVISSDYLLTALQFTRPNSAGKSVLADTPRALYYKICRHLRALIYLIKWLKPCLIGHSPPPFILYSPLTMTQQFTIHRVSGPAAK